MLTTEGHIKMQDGVRLFIGSCNSARHRRMRPNNILPI